MVSSPASSWGGISGKGWSGWPSSASVIWNAGLSNSSRVVPRDELLGEIWGFDFVGETRTLDMHIKTLRAKLHDDVENPRYIKTIRSVGYKFIG